EAALKDSEEQLRLAIQATGLGLFDRDIVHGTLRWSQRCKAIFGLPADSPINYELFLEHLHPEDRPRIEKAIQRATDPAQGGIYEAEYRCVWDDGTVRWVSGKGRALFEEHEGSHRAIRMVGTVQDITARKDAEVQLNVAKDAAEK